MINPNLDFMIKLINNKKFYVIDSNKNNFRNRIVYKMFA